MRERYHRREERKREIDKDETRRAGHAEERGRTGGTARQIYPGPELHFQPPSEYKRQFNYRGIFKGAVRSRAPCLSASFLLSSLSFPACLPLFRASASPRFLSPRSVDGACTVYTHECNDMKTRYLYIYIYTHPRIYLRACSLVRSLARKSQLLPAGERAVLATMYRWTI